MQTHEIFGTDFFFVKKGGGAYGEYMGNDKKYRERDLGQKITRGKVQNLNIFLAGNSKCQELSDSASLD